MGSFRPAVIIRKHFTLSSLLVLTIAFIDHWTPPDLSVFLFYFLPIAYTTTRGSKADTYFIAAACSVIWFVVNLNHIERYRAAIYLWNGAVRVTVFFFIASLLLRRKAQAEHLAAAESRLQVLYRRESEIARHDSLTRVLNFRGFKERLAEEASRSNRFKHPMALLYLDLDRFKEFNDLQGHQKGDEILQATAAAIRSTIRQIDSVGRVGGDEFVILLPETPAEGAAECAKHIRDALKTRVGVSASIGIAASSGTYPGDEEMIRLADKAMYRVKHAIQNQP